MGKIKNAAVVSDRATDKEKLPHPLEAEFQKAGLTAQIVDDYPTQPWGARAWCEHVEGPPATCLRGRVIWEPCANRGFMVKGLKDYSDHVFGSDIFDYAPHYPDRNFPTFPLYNFLDLQSGQIGGAGLPKFLPGQPDWIVFNPPFSRAEEFIQVALEHARIGVAALCRLAITETVGRYKTLFGAIEPERWAWSQFVERLPLAEGKCTRDQKTMTAYGWLTIWQEPQDPRIILRRRHIPPCRTQLEKADDYR